jgi:sulfatase maturation enzyme AslB (radical SAM superfamily)
MYSHSNDYKWNQIQSIIKLLHSRGRLYEQFNKAEIWTMANNIYDWFIEPEDEQDYEASVYPYHWSKTIKDINNREYPVHVSVYVNEKSRELVWQCYDYANS